MSAYNGKQYYTLRHEKEFLTEIGNRFHRTQVSYSEPQLIERSHTRQRFGNVRLFVAAYLTGLSYRTADFGGQSELAPACRAEIIEFARSLV